MAIRGSQGNAEQDILASLQAGEYEAALARILRRYGPELQSYLLGVLRDEQTAKEVFCDVGFELWQALPTFRGECSARSFAYRLSRHAALRRKRDPFRR